MADDTIDRERAQELLAKAQELQTDLWMILADLESELDIEIDANEDLENQTIESLIEAHGTDDDQAEEEDEDADAS